MTKRAFIIHGWDGYPEEGWLPWLKRELEARGFEVTIPAMPESAAPKIGTWIPHLAKLIGEPDEQTYLIGHSIGCQAILRYLETIAKDTKIGGAVLVAGWADLTPAGMATPQEQEIGRPWIETLIQWDIIRQRSRFFVAIFSDNDYFVPLDNSTLFKEKLGAETIVEHDKGHFSGSDGVTELPSALEALLRHV